MITIHLTLKIFILAVIAIVLVMNIRFIVSSIITIQKYRKIGRIIPEDIIPRIVVRIAIITVLIIYVY